MGQQPPLIPPQGGIPPSSTASLPNMPDISSMLQGITPEQLQQGMAAVADPKVMAQVQQSLANPNAGDMFRNGATGQTTMGQPGIPPGTPPGMQPGMPPGMNPQDPMSMLPISPEGMAVGAVGGVAMGQGFELLAGKDGQGPLAKMARSIDNLPGVRHVSSWLDNKALPMIKGNAADRVLGRVTTEVAEQQLIQENVKKHAGQFAEKLERHTTVTGMKEAIEKITNSSLQETVRLGNAKGMTKEGLESLAKGMLAGNPELLEKVTGQATIDGMKKVLAEAAAIELPAAQRKALEGVIRLNTGVAEQLKPTYSAHQAVLANLPGQSQSLQKSLPQLQAAVTSKFSEGSKAAATINEKLAKATTLQAAEEILAKESQAVQTATKDIIKGIHKESVGPIGRAIASTGQTFKRVFSGEMMTESMSGLRMPGANSKAKAATKAAEEAAARAAGEVPQKASFLGKFLGPAMMGVATIGMSYTSAKKAEKGDKVKTFFHDFLGVGLGGFLGWEVGRKALRASNIITKILPFAKNSLPLLRRFMPKATVGGLIIELLAMFVIAKPFQSAGEKLSDKLFGKPKSKILEEQQKAQAKGQLPPGAMPAQPGATPLQPGRRGVFEQFNRAPQQAAPGAFSISPDEIRGNPAQASDAAAGASAMTSMGDMSAGLDLGSLTGGSGGNMFMPGGG